MGLIETQEISVHGIEPAAESSRAQGQDARYSKDLGHCAILEDKKGATCPVPTPETEADELQPGSEPIEATFELNDTLYAKAEIPATEEVFLWLGVGYKIKMFEEGHG